MNMIDVKLAPYAAGEIIQFVSIDFECPIELLYEAVEFSAAQPSPER